MNNPLASTTPIKTRAAIIGVFAWLSLLGGCGQSQGELLFVLGFGRGAKVQAKFQLTQNPILILIDDVENKIDWPPTKSYLFDELSQELLHNKAAQKIVPNKTLIHLMQSVPDFEKRGAREIGRLADADQVIWIEVKSFEAEELIQEAIEAANFVVTIKVLDVHQQRRSRVRLWPDTPQGKRLTVTMTGSEVQMAKTKDRISKKLSELMAFQIARLFYDHRLGDFERPVQ